LVDQENVTNISIHAARVGPGRMALVPESHFELNASARVLYMPALGMPALGKSAELASRPIED
jgi:hypothetical protein